MVRVSEVYRELLSCILRNKHRNILLVLGLHWQRSDKETKQNFLGFLKGSSQCPPTCSFPFQIGNVHKAKVVCVLSLNECPISAVIILL